MSSVLRALDSIRAADWWSYKIPPLLLTAYAGFVYFPHADSAWTVPARAILAILLIAIFGYVQNDVCDIDADRQAGRPNRMSRVGPLGRMLWIVLPGALALLLAWTTGDAPLTMLVAANLIVPTLYSVKPVRLKGRGIWGALADSAGVHTLPMAIVARAVTVDVLATTPAMVFVWSAIGWAAFAGLRGIIVHQVVDADDDAAAGVQTFGGRLGPVRARALIMRTLLPLEIVSLAVFLVPMLLAAPFVVAALILFTAAETVKVRRGWTMPLFYRGEVREPYVPIVNNEIYEVWLPIAFALQLAMLRPVMVVLVAAHVYLFLPNIKLRLAVSMKVMEPSP